MAIKPAKKQPKWRNSAQLRGYLGQLIFAIDHNEDGKATLPVKTLIGLKEIVYQAIHTEVGHGS